MRKMPEQQRNKYRMESANASPTTQRLWLLTGETGDMCVGVYVSVCCQLNKAMTIDPPMAKTTPNLVHKLPPLSVSI